jgi:membrane fusion protein, multidrug efflux system
MKKLRQTLITLALLLVLGVACYIYWITSLQQIISTNNAYIKTDNITVSSKVGGYVSKVAVNSNELVQENQLLVQIESSDFAAKVEQQQAAYDSQQVAIEVLVQQKKLQTNLVLQATTSLQMSTARANNAITDYQRDLSLFNQGFATEEQTNNSRLAADLARLQLDRSNAELAASKTQQVLLDTRSTALQADLRQVGAVAKVGKLDLSYATVSSPVRGIVGSKSIEVGQFIRPGMQLFSIVPEGKNYVIANFKETQISSLRIGQKASIAIDAFPDLRLVAVIESIGPSTGSEFSVLPPENAIGNFTKIVQRIPIKLTLSDDGKRSQQLRPGMSVTVSIDSRQNSAAVTPASTGFFAPQRW